MSPSFWRVTRMEAVGLVILLAGLVGWAVTGNARVAVVGEGVGAVFLLALTIWPHSRPAKNPDRPR